mmetsp:Transcript_13314/g.24988  ORF Transcript_13314/g.24988 Transcript_13314/m.24988 type:complete len:760 (-) Transcript_13314:3209-5488(-)
MGKKSKRRTKSTNKAEANASSVNPTSANATSEAPAIEETTGKSATSIPKNAPESKENDPAITVTSTSVPPQSVPGVPASLLPQAVEVNLHLFNLSQQNLVKALCSIPTNQAHIFSSWSEPATTDDAKRKLVEQLERIDKAYPSGLVGYIKNARDLLEKSQKGVNPLEGWKPEVPQGENFEIGTEEFDDFEKVGLQEMGKCGFVLVAGGLGERLGYGGIKLGLPIELATEMTYLQYYIETILAIQNRYANPGVKLPLCIMVSNDTNTGTIQLLEENDYFGMDRDQFVIVQQGDGVPALKDNSANIAMDKKNPSMIEAKPHGHGDIHALLYSNNVALNWCKKRLEWVIFFQDTNGLAFHTLPLALGVSKRRDLIMNSIAVPRKGKQAIGGIAKLVNKDGEERTINVEYNQLDPLLRASGFPDGDVDDPKTGHSPFPGNINQLLFKLKPYAEALLRTKGAMPEFVNPKYADESKTAFKKPTRLECMMQDFPNILSGDAAKHVGFTSIASELCFSPVKNATEDGVALQMNGTAPGVAATGEADQYAAIRKIMRSIGCIVEDAAEETFNGISVIPGPEIVVRPSFAVCPAEYKCRFPEPSKIKISKRSSLVISGNVVIESLDLDGALVIECEEGASGTISGLVVNNKGWEKIAENSNDSPEYVRIRGYKIKKEETKEIVFKKDGSVSGYTPHVSFEQVPVLPTISTSPDTPKSKKYEDDNNLASPSLKQALAIDSDISHERNLNLHEPRTPEAAVKQAECCVIS